MKTKTEKILALLPTDEEVAQWYDLNIDPNDSTVSSSIYKFRLFLKDNITKKLESIKHDLVGFEYSEERI